MRTVTELGGPRRLDRLGENGEAIAVRFESQTLAERNRQFIAAGCQWKWPEFKAHVTLAWDAAKTIAVDALDEFNLDLIFGREIVKEVNDNWADKSKPKSLIPGSVYASRKILNAEEIASWCRDRSIQCNPADLHVTIMFSKTPPVGEIPPTDVGSIVNRRRNW